MGSEVYGLNLPLLPVAPRQHLACDSYVFGPCRLKCVYVLSELQEETTLSFIPVSLIV